MAVAPRAYRFTVEEYEHMVAAGVLSPDQRVELIEGEIIEMAPIGDPHASVVDRLNMLLTRHLGDRCIVRVQGPVRFPSLRSRPQPDLALLRRRADWYASSSPSATDIRLLIEVMDTSVEHDRRRKTPLYARAGVPEVWLVDIPARLLDVHRGPGEREYAEVRTARPGERVAPLAFPDVALRVDDILG
jgi:Uma2 family endonuclease